MRNTCAQRAAAHVISQHTHQPWRPIYQHLLATHPPDTPLRLLGTTPARLAAALHHHGIPATTKRHAHPTDLHAGTIACIDLRALHGGPPRLHWTLLEDVTDHAVRADGRWHTMERWMRAWTCRASPFPMHRRALVVPELTLTG